MRSGLTLLLVVSVLAGPARARAQQAPAPHASRTRRTLVFLAGAAAGLAVHESGHVFMGAAFGAHPGIRRISVGPIPFFAIRHDRVSRGREFLISSAGLWLQNAGEEWILTAHPRLRQQPAPFLKGLFAFDLATSAVYGVAAFGRIGPPERDTRGMAASLGRRGIPEPVVGVFVLAPAVLDSYRYVRPDAAWARWASRGAKAALVLLAVAAGR